MLTFCLVYLSWFQNNDEAKDRQKKIYDEKIKIVEEVPLEVDDAVLLKINARKRPLESKFKGPYKITEFKNGKVKLGGLPGWQKMETIKKHMTKLVYIYIRHF